MASGINSTPSMSAASSNNAALSEGVAFGWASTAPRTEVIHGCG